MTTNRVTIDGKDYERVAMSGSGYRPFCERCVADRDQKLCRALEKAAGDCWNSVGKVWEKVDSSKGETEK